MFYFNKGSNAGGEQCQAGSAGWNSQQAARRSQPRFPPGAALGILLSTGAKLLPSQCCQPWCGLPGLIAAFEDLQALGDTCLTAVVALHPYGVPAPAKGGCFPDSSSTHGWIRSRNSSVRGSVRDDANGVCQNSFGGNKNSSWTKTYFCSWAGVLVLTALYRCCQSRAGKGKCSVMAMLLGWESLGFPQR